MNKIFLKICAFMLYIFDQVQEKNWNKNSNSIIKNGQIPTGSAIYSLRIPQGVYSKFQNEFQLARSLELEKGRPYL